MHLPALLVIGFVALTSSASINSRASNPQCRFAPLYTQKEIVKNPEPFINDLLFWEGHFAKPGVGYNGANGMTYDGTLLRSKTGLEWAQAAGRHNFSAASKESLH